jgi:putative ribosome biogenesis GTPase RsgA
MTFDLASLGWDAGFASAYTEFATAGPDQRPGRVVRTDRGVCTVLTAAGTVRASLAGGLLTAAGRDPAALPCVGDWVVVRVWPDGPVTAEAVLPRRTVVARRTAGKESTGQVLAANIDTAAVIEPIDPSPHLGRIERLLALAWESGARPLVVLTKADLAADPATVAAQVADAAPGVEVLPVSAARGRGVDRLRTLVPPGRTLALLGPSGAGKSTLVNALAGATVMATQRVRRACGRSGCATPPTGWTGRSRTWPRWPRRAGSPTAPTRPSRAARCGRHWPPGSWPPGAGRAGGGCGVSWRTRRAAGTPGRPRRSAPRSAPRPGGWPRRSARRPGGWPRRCGSVPAGDERPVRVTRRPARRSSDEPMSVRMARVAPWPTDSLSVGRGSTTCATSTSNCPGTR